MLRKVKFRRVKGFKILLHPKDLERIFPVSKFNNSSVLLLQAMTGLDILFINLDTNLSKDIAHCFLKDTIVNRTRVLRWEYWAFSQHCLSVLRILSTILSLTILTTAISASNFFKWVRVPLISFGRSEICEPRVVSVFRSSCTNSGLVSLFNTAPVSVRLIVVSSLQY